MDRFDWRQFLQGLSEEEVRDKQNSLTLPADVDRTWLGFAGASEQEIRALEERIGTELPRSYRAFLLTSNGWLNLGAFISRLWSAAEVDWFSVRNQDWIDAYAGLGQGARAVTDEEYFNYGDGQDSTSFRPEYLQTALEISDVGDSAILLLNPKVVTPDGEWEAWFFANWLPGARRYRSFEELMVAERKAFNQLRSNPVPAVPKRPGLLGLLWREIADAFRTGFGARRGS